MTKSQSTKKEAKAKAEPKPKRENEADLTAKHNDVLYDAKGAISPNNAPLVKGSLRYETEGLYAGKQTVERKCAFSGRVFRLATSDLFQKFVDDEAIKEIRRMRAKAKRAAKRAETKDEEEIVAEALAVA